MDDYTKVKKNVDEYQSIHIALMVDNLILIALKMYSLLQVTQILQKMKLNVFWKKLYIATEMQEINKTNARGQNKEKNFMLGFYKKISTLFGPLFKPHDEQSDAADMYDLESEKYTDQEEKGLKILTTSQMLSKLSITLA